jgi:carboxymethylenebutenolidase
MPSRDVSIAARDGTIDAKLITTDGAGPWPGVMMLADALGPRPQVYAMAQRVADNGYAVLVPNPYYRSGKAPVVNPDADFANEADRNQIMAQMMALTPERIADDAGAESEFLSAQPEVSKGKLGVTGYCMGGGMALRFAAARPDLIGAAASYHGGMLATDAPESPHHLLPHVSAELYFGHADNDELMDASAIDKFEKALKESGKAFTSELYPDAPHGFAVPGRDTFRADAAERHYETMIGLFDRALA